MPTTFFDLGYLPVMPRHEKPSDPTIEEIFGQVVREKRRALGLRLIDLQTDGGIDRSHIGKIEAGKVQVCLRGIIQIAEGLEMSPGELLDEARRKWLMHNK